MPIKETVPSWDETEAVAQPKVIDTPSWEDTVEKKNNEEPVSVSSGSVSSDIPSAATPIEEPMVESPRRELSFKEQKQNSSIPDVMGLFNKKEQINQGINQDQIKSIGESAKNATYPAMFVYKADQVQKRLDAISKHFPELSAQTAEIKKQQITPTNIGEFESAISELEQQSGANPTTISYALNNPQVASSLTGKDKAYFDYYKGNVDTESNALVNTLSASNERLEKAKEAISRTDNEKGFDKVGGVTENVVKGLWGGVSDYFKDYVEVRERIKSNPKTQELTKKLEEGNTESLSTEDRVLAKMVLDNYNLNKDIKDKIPSSYSMAKGAGMSGGFMLEFMLTGGFGGTVSKAITKGTTKLIAEGVTVSAAKKIGIGTAAKLADAGIQTTWMPSFWKGTAEDVSRGDSFIEAVSKNYYKTFAETFTEKLFLKNPWNKGSVGAVDNIMGRMGINMHTDKGAFGFFINQGEEFGEEKISQLMTAPLDYDNLGAAWKDFWDVKKNAELFGTVAMITAPASMVSQSERAYDNIKLNRIGKEIPTDVRSEIDEVFKDRKLTVKDQYDLIGKIVEDRAANKTLGESPAETAGNIIRYAQQKTKQVVVSGIEERAKTPTVGTREEITPEDQAKVDYLESQGIAIPNGSGIEQVNALYEAEKAKEATAEAKEPQTKPIEPISEAVDPLSSESDISISTEEKTPLDEQKPTEIKSIENTIVNYDGVKGRLVKEKDGYFVVDETGERHFVERGESGISSEELGVYKENELPEYNPEDSSINYLGNKYTYESVNVDGDGNTTSINVIDGNGRNKTIRNKFVVEEIEYQKVLSEMEQRGDIDDIDNIAVDNVVKELNITPNEKGRIKETVEQVQQTGQAEGIAKTTTGEAKAVKQEVSQLNLKQDGKESSQKASTQADEKRRQVLKEKSMEADRLLSEGLSDLADLVGAKISVTGEQRVRVKQAIGKVAKGLILKGEVAIEKLVQQIKEHFLKANIDISEDLINETLKEEGYAKSTGTKTTEGSVEQKVVEGEKGQVRVRNTSEGQETTGGKVKYTAEKSEIGHFAQRTTLDETNLPEETKNRIREQGIGKYTVMTDAESIAIAENIAKNNDYTTIKELVFDLSIHPSVRMNLMLEAFKESNAQIEKALKEKRNDNAVWWYDEQASFAAEIDDKIARNAAYILRGLGTAAALNMLAPMSHVRRYEKEVTAQRKKLQETETHKNSLKKTQKAAKQAYDDAVEGAINSPEVKKVIEQNKGKETSAVKPDRLKELKLKEKALIEKLKKSTRGTFSSGGITTEGLEAIGELAVVYLEEAAYVTSKAVKKLVKTLKSVNINVTEEEALKYFPDEIDGKKLTDIQKEEETEKAAAKLAQNIIRLTEDESKEVADAVKKMVMELTKKIKETLPEKSGKEKEKESPFAIIKNAILQKEYRMSVWTSAKEKAISDVENSKRDDIVKQDMISTIESAYEEATEFMFATSEIKDAIAIIMKRRGISISSISKQKIADIKIAIEDVANEVIDGIGLEEDLSSLKKAIKKSVGKDVVLKIKNNKDVAAKKEIEKARKLQEKESQKKSDVELIAERLGVRLAKEMTDTERKEVSKIQEAVNILLAKSRERDVDRKKKQPKTDLEIISDAIKNRTKYADAWAEANVIAINAVNDNKSLTEEQKTTAINRINEVYKKATSFTFTEAQVDRAIKRKMADLDIKIRDIVKEFYDIQSLNRGKLKDTLIEESGLSKEQATILGDAIEKRFDSILKQGTESIIEKYIGKIKEGKTKTDKVDSNRRKQASAELLELINIGAFDRSDFREAYATAVGIPEFNKTHADNIRKFGEDIQRQKEPIIRHKKIQDLLGYMQLIKGVGLSDMAVSMWYANVLSGIKTQERNFVGGFSGVTIRLLSDTLLSGRYGAMLRGAKYGAKAGLTKAKDVWKYGYAPFSERVEIPNTAEIVSAAAKEANVRSVFRLIKYVGRAMNALDILNAEIGKESYATILANEAMNVSRSKALFSSEYRKQVKEMTERHLSIDKETTDRLKAEIEEDSKEFGYTELEKKVILLDRINRLRPSELEEQAAKFGVFSTGNVQSYGNIGRASDKIAQLLKGVSVVVWVDKKTGEKKIIHPLALFAAFTKIAGNVSEMSLNYVPGVGLYRVFLAKGYGQTFNGVGESGLESKYAVDLTPRERKTVLGMQLLGFTAMAFFYAMSEPGDDQDPLIKITANGTGDFGKNKSLKDWQEYSLGIKIGDGQRVWISYKYTPLILPLSIIGFVRDSKQYRSEYSEESDMNLITKALTSLPSFVTDMTAIKSMVTVLDDVINSAKSADTQSMAKSLAKTMTGFYTPTLYKDITGTLEALYGVGVDTPIKGGSVQQAKQIFMGRNPISIIKRMSLPEEDRVEQIDVYGRKVPVKGFWNEIFNVSSMNEEDKMISEHENKMGVPSIPQIKVNKFNALSNGSYTPVVLDDGDQRERLLWHKFVGNRGRYIVEAIDNNKSISDKELYKEIMDKAISDATSRARTDIELEIMSNPLDR